MIDNMNILQKAYNAIKQTIKFEFFKRKFNNWCETREIDVLDKINKNNERITIALANEQFATAFYCFEDNINLEQELKQLSDFKNFILNKSNETDDN